MPATYGHRKYQAPWDSSLCCCVYSVRDLVVLSYISRGVVRWGNPRGEGGGDGRGGDGTGKTRRESETRKKKDELEKTERGRDKKKV